MLISVQQSRLEIEGHSVYTNTKFERAIHFYTFLISVPSPDIRPQSATESEKPPLPKNKQKKYKTHTHLH